VQTHLASETPTSYLSEESGDSNYQLDRDGQSRCIFSERLRSITLNSRQSIQNGVERIIARIKAICEESAMAAEDRSSINLDALVDFVWPQPTFEGYDKDFFCKYRYTQVTSEEERLADTLDSSERESLVIILSLKEGICEELHKMGFHEKLQVQGCSAKSPSYEWQIRRFCDSGTDFISWLHLKWSVAEAVGPEQTGDESLETEDHLTDPYRERPQGTQERTDKFLSFRV